MFSKSESSTLLSSLCRVRYSAFRYLGSLKSLLKKLAWYRTFS